MERLRLLFNTCAFLGLIGLLIIYNDPYLIGEEQWSLPTALLFFIGGGLAAKQVKEEDK
jgi:hypothetical protein